MRSSLPLLRPRSPVSSVGGGWLQQRATLEGLEVSDSNWAEWVAAEAEAQQRTQQASQRREAVPLLRLATPKS